MRLLMLMLVIFMMMIYCAKSNSNNASSCEDFNYSQNIDLTQTGTEVNVDIINNNSLVFKQNPFMLWKGPHNFDKNSTVFYLSIDRTNNGMLKDHENNGIWLWLINNNNQTVFKDNFYLQFMEENQSNLEEDFIYGIDKKFEGMGIKINELNLVSIINDKKNSIEKSDFNTMKNKLAYKYKIQQCEIASSKRLTLRITFLNDYVYVESKNSTKEKGDFELCFLAEFNTVSPSFLISGGLKDENTIFTFDTVTMNTIESFKYRITKEEDAKISQILKTKLEIIDRLGKDAFDKTVSMKKVFDVVLNSQTHFDNINELDKMKFDMEVLSDILNEKATNSTNNNNSTLSPHLTHSTYSIDEKLINIVDTIRNLTFDKASALKSDPRQNLLKSLDDLRSRQLSMNVSIIEMYKSTLSSLEEIKQKAEEMETYKLFQQVLFIAIFINALILFAMYKNITEKEKEKEEVEKRGEIKMSV